MSQHISFISDHYYNLCEFCGESPYELKSTFTCNNGESTNTFIATNVSSVQTLI